MADPVAGLDAAFLLTESSTMPWHVLGIFLVDPRGAPELFNVDSVRRVVAARLDHIEAFGKVIAAGPLGMWQSWTDGEVDVDWHVRDADLAPDADLADLEAFAGRLAETPLDRTRPLWELHVVEQLADGRAAVVAKVHHALADGVTAVGILAGLLDLEPVPPGPAAVDLVPSEPHRPMTLTAVPGLVWRAGWGVARAIVRAARRGVRSGRHSFGFMAPRTSGHDRLTNRRQIAMAVLDVADVKTAKDAYGVTFNDVVLPAITTAARRWLDEDDQLPGRSLLATVPVSIRSPDGEPLVSVGDLRVAAGPRRRSGRTRSPDRCRHRPVQAPPRGGRSHHVG